MIFFNRVRNLSALPLLVIPVFILSCKSYKKNQSHKDVPDSFIAKGEKLAAIHCQSCHMLPDPSLLDSKSWKNGVLPAMGPRLGIFSDGLRDFPSSKHDIELEKGFYPSKPALSQEDWKYIIDYYSSVSPDTLALQERKRAVKQNETLFKVEAPSYKNDLPATCLVKIDTTILPRQLLVADMINKNIFRFDKHLSLVDSFNNGSTIVDIELHNRNFITCNIGIMSPNNGKYGSVGRVNVDKKGKMYADTVLKFKQLARPVQITSADFNNDKKTDYLICEFGNLTGALSWMENTGDNNYIRHVLRNLPGAIDAFIRDVNKDGLPDIWVLFAQGEEGVFLFTNKGNNEFEQKQVLRFQSMFGSSHFELTDFNKDGAPDILYTCGDNADYSAVLKPYHGVYIFMNDGNNNFKQEYFFPMHGCYKAIAKDFDGDGDLDIAAISFFADYVNHPEESFIYLENDGNTDYQPFSIPNTTSGRWLTMDAGDIDGDGKIDLILGNFSVAPASIKHKVNWKDGPPFIVLKNMIKK